MKATIIILGIITAVLVLITGGWDDVNQVVFPNSNWGLYNRNFFENLLVEVHGTVIDLLVVGVIIYWFDKMKTKREAILKAKEELNYSKYYCGKDASFRFYGSLKYLLSLGVSNVSIPEGNLSNLKIDDLKLSSSNLIAANFSNSKLNQVDFNNCELEAAQFIDAILKKVSFKNTNLRRSKFINAQLKGVDFRSCDIRGANFANSSLQSANFRGVDCSQVSFKGANLRSANFMETINLTRGMILVASNHEHIKLPEGVEI